MPADPRSRQAAIVIILLGCLVAAVATLVPFYHVGYQVDAIALAVLLTPFVVYGMFVESLRGPWLLASGVILLGVSVAVVLDERFPYEGYVRLYWVPLAAMAIVLPVAYALGRRDPYS